MDIDLAVIADAATLDGTGKLNILGIFDRLSASSFPAQHPRIVLVLRFLAAGVDTGSHSIQIRLSDPEGEEVLRLDGTLQVRPRGAPGGVTRIPHILNLDGVSFQKPGTHVFDVRVDGSPIRSLPLTVAHGGSGGRPPARA